MTAPAAPATVDTPRARRLRLVGIAVLAAVVAGASWFSLRAGPRTDRPEEVFDYIRDRILAGDGGALWRRMSPRAREDYATFVRIMVDPREGQGTAMDREEWRRKMGLSKEELRKLSPEQVMSRESLACAEEFYRGARVFSVDRWDEDTAYLKILTRSGHDRFWVVARVDGSWRVDNLWPALTEQGWLLPRPGEQRRKIPTAPPELPPADRAATPKDR